VDVLACLAAPPARVEDGDLPSWIAAITGAPAGGHVARAFWCGLRADRLGYAFAGGYREAVARLLATAGRDAKGMGALAATESGGAHPRAIATRLEGDVLHGEKTFATLATVADELLVVASRGATEDGRNELVVARVATSAAGLSITPRAETPFAPEIPHARVRLDGVRASEILPGDGYAAYLKPFRTIEDVHVLAATLGYLAGAARAYGWDDALAEVAALAVALEALGAKDASLPEVHVALHGVFTATRRVLASLAWDRAEATERARWERDAPLLLVAETARTKRLEAARRALAR
jgi:alkylation response protein AidB-like acyl-CoA dehydrogenase